MTKAQAREHYRRLRYTLSAEDQQHLSWRLADRFMEEVELSGVLSLNSFLPLAHLNEPDTFPLLERISRDRTNVRISVPYLPEGVEDLVPAAWEPGMEMVKGAFDTLHPEHPERVLFAELDMVLVPLLACDGFGYRVGYGKGYYDRFLQKCRPQVKKIGISFFEPVDVIDDIWEGDVRLDALLTPDHLIVFGPESGLKKDIP